MFKFEQNRTYLMPAHFGAAEARNGSVMYNDVTTAMVTYTTDREKLQSYLPAPFEVGDEAVVTVSYALNRDIDWLAGRAYNVICVTASAFFNGKVDKLVGEYNLVLWENMTDPILAGRELQGMPKIFADIPDSEVVGNRFSAEASHFGSRFFEMDIDAIEPVDAAQIESMQEARKGKDHWMAWRHIPSVGGMGTTVSEPTLFPIEAKVSEISLGTGSLKWHRLTWEQNPTQAHIVNALADLPILEYGWAAIVRGNQNLYLPDNPPRVIR